MEVCNLPGRDISIAVTYRLPEAHCGAITQWCRPAQTTLLYCGAFPHTVDLVSFILPDFKATFFLRGGVQQ